jgi:hypothetical protein
MLKIRLFLAALIFWVCVFIINLIRPPASDFSLLEDAFWSEKISWKNRFDLVAAGDSRTLIAISPQTMQNVLPGYKIANLGFAAMIYSQEYLDYVRNALISPVKDRVIVLGFSPRSLLPHEKPNCFFRKWMSEDRIPFRIELNRNSGWLYALFRELSANDLNIDFHKTNHAWLMICLESGWVASRLFPERPRGSQGTYRTTFIKNKIDEKLLEIIYRNTGNWTREGIKVFGIRIPASPGLLKIENEISGFNEHSIRQRFEKSGGVWLNPAIDSLIAHDGSHLRYDSAVFYSNSLAYELKKFLEKR